jgi:hypothetical protein
MYFYCYCFKEHFLSALLIEGFWTTVLLFCIFNFIIKLLFGIDNSGNNLNTNNHWSSLLSSQSTRRRQSSWDLNSELTGWIQSSWMCFWWGTFKYHPYLKDLVTGLPVWNLELNGSNGLETPILTCLSYLWRWLIINGFIIINYDHDEFHLQKNIYYLRIVMHIKKSSIWYKTLKFK